MSDTPASEEGGRTLVGTVVSCPDPALAESLAHAFDFVWIDLEHGAITLRDMQVLTIAVQGRGCAAHARLPRWDSEHLSAALDAGVDGIVAPMVETPEAASGLVRRLRYPPRGTRGFGPRRAGDYGRTSAFWTSPVAHVTCTVQIESARALDNAGAIAAVEGIDALVVGTADLSLALGVPQELDSPKLREAVRNVESATAPHQVGYGVAAGGDVRAVRDLVSGPLRLVVYSVDLRLYAGAVDAAAADMRQALEGRHVST